MFILAREHGIEGFRIKLFLKGKFTFGLQMPNVYLFGNMYSTISGIVNLFIDVLRLSESGSIRE